MAVADEVAKAADRAKQKLVEEAGRAMVKGAIDDLTLTPEEREAKAKEKAAGDKSMLIKAILGVTGVVVAGIVIMKVLAALWLYGIALVVIAGLGGVGYLVARPKIEAFKQQRLAAQQQRLAAKAEADSVRERAAAEAAVEAQKRAAQQRLEDELAKLKGRV